MKKIFNHYKPFIVSCQALEDEPMYGEGIMLKMAQAALKGGADFIRTSQLHNIKEMKDKLTVPLIGLIKKKYPNSSVVITPSIKEVQELIDTGVDIIALDATTRKRPKESLQTIVDFAVKNKLSNQLLMADCSTIEDIKNAIKLNFDIIGTTLRGYTEETKGKSNAEGECNFIEKAAKICNENNCILIAEGGLNTPKDVKAAFEKGAHGVVVGSAITRPRFITETFVKEIKRR